MATQINVNGKIVTRPGVYASTKSGIRNPPLSLSYGNIVIIDAGLGAGWGGGAGVTGALTQGVDSVYSFNTIQDFRAFVKGGPLWDAAGALFRPAGNGINGVSTVNIIQSRTTVQATMTATFTNGSLVIKTKDEGLNANGVLTSSILTQGHAFTLTPGTVNTAKYILSFYHGAFTGIDSLNNVPYDGTTAINSTPILITRSPEVATLAEIVAWMATSVDFTTGYQLTTSTITTTGAIVPGDLVTNAGYKIATGATETYATGDFTAALAAVKDVDFTFFLSTDSGTDATNIRNTTIQDYLDNDSKFERFLVIAGGGTKAEFTTQSIVAANYYNSDKVIIVHGQGKKTSRTGFSIKSQFYKAAAVLGRTCGIETQVPVTFKSIAIDGEVHKLSDDEQELALAEGVLATIYDNELGYYVVLQGINSLQQNAYLVNDDGSSHDMAVKRITAQLNKEIIINAKKTFFGKATVGPNRNTITEDDLKAWLEGFLQNKCASSITDNLIIRFGNISATVTQDTFYVTYEFVPNYPVNKIVFTGVILEN